MPRDGASLSFDESKAQQFTPVHFALLDFANGFVKVNTSVYSLTFGGNTYVGIGNLGGISTIQEGTDLQARGIELTLTGIPPDFISIAQNEDYQGRSCKIFTGFLDTQHQLIPDPVLIGDWRMDVMDISLGKVATVTLKAESRLIDWDAPKASRWTNEEQQRKFPGDTGLKLLVINTDKTFLWGKG